MAVVARPSHSVPSTKVLVRRAAAGTDYHTLDGMDAADGRRMAEEWQKFGGTSSSTPLGSAAEAAARLAAPVAGFGRGIRLDEATEAAGGKASALS